MPSVDNSTSSHSTVITNKSWTSNINRVPSEKQSVISSSESKNKLTNVFYSWYPELCRRQNSNPVNAVKPTHLKNDKVLEFLADRIKVDDWTPILNALRLDTSLHVIGIHSRLDTQKQIEDADTEEKAKKLRKWFGAICTKYVLKNLIRALNSTIKRSEVLTYLELDGLRIHGEFLSSILSSVVESKNIKYLSFKSCPIEDDGCFEICETIHDLPNVEMINMSGCNLTSKSAEYIAKLIKYQQINRYCESWHTSLRYEEPAVNNMAGLKRITINNNPKIGDQGTELILNELIDDLWIKAIDMQRCGITEGISSKILDTIEYNKSLEVADFRHNYLDQTTFQKILEIIKDKDFDDSSTVYKWCLTSTSLASTLDSYMSTIGTSTVNSKPIKKTINSKSTTNKGVKKDSKETISNNTTKTDNSNLIKAKEQLLQLYERLKNETIKRQQAETKCALLQKQVNDLKNLHKNQMILKEFANMKQYISKFITFLKHNDMAAQHQPMITDLQRALNEVRVISKPFEDIDSEEVPAIQHIKEQQSRIEINPQAMFENILGNERENDSTVDLSDFISDLKDESQKNSLATESPRSSDSESIDDYKRLLEDLSQNDDSSNKYSSDSLSALSSSSEDRKENGTHTLKKLLVKIPFASMYE